MKEKVFTKGEIIFREGDSGESFFQIKKGTAGVYIRYGEKVYSPIVTEGECDYIISFEKLEAARYAACLRKGGKIIVNTQEIDPMPVMIGAATYPGDVLETLKGKGYDVDDFDALTPTIQAGSAKAVNIVLMGRLSRYFDFPEEDWLQSIEACVPAKFVELNKKAFAL